jgi:diacylglycerol O-acyltransferase / wax synthase
MRQLTSFDAQILALEDGRNHAHVSALAICDPSDAPEGRVTLEAVRDLVGSRLHLLPPLRWRLAEVPFGLDYPYWVDAAEFDLDFHIRELAIPAPGDRKMLAEQVARIVSRPLDRSRPLWELYLIQGLEGGRVAMLTKIHHAAVDGASVAELLGIMLDSEPAPPTSPPAASENGEEMPSQLRMLARGMAALPRQPVRALRAAPRVLPHLDEIPTMRSVPGVHTLAAAGRRAVRQRPIDRDGGVLEGRELQAPASAINRKITPHRRLALSRQPLDEVKLIKNHFDVTVNDVVVTICAGALRSWLDARGELPEEPLIAMVPVSVRTAEEAGTYGNRVSAMLVPIPTDEPDPKERLRKAHESLRTAKEHHKAVPASVMQDANHVVPPALLVRASRVTTMVNAREAPVNVVISNVPGPTTPLYLAGAQIEAIHPVSAIMDGIGLNLTVMSYCGGLDFGAVADRDIVDDPWPLASALAEAQDELLALVPEA